MQNKFVGHNPFNVLEHDLPSYNLLFKMPKDAKALASYKFYGLILRVVPTSYYKRNINFELILNMDAKDHGKNVTYRKVMFNTPQECSQLNNIFKYPSYLFHAHDQIVGDAYLIQVHDKKYLKINSMQLMVPIV